MLHIDTFVRTRENRADLPSVRLCSVTFARWISAIREPLSFADAFSQGACTPTDSARARRMLCVCVQGHGRPQNSIFRLICQAVTGKRNSRSLFRAAAANSRQPSGFFRFAFYDRARESPGGREGIAKSARKIDGLTFAIATGVPPRVTEASRDECKRDRRDRKKRIASSQGSFSAIASGGFSTESLSHPAN